MERRLTSNLPTPVTTAAASVTSQQRSLPSPVRGRLAVALVVALLTTALTAFAAFVTAQEAAPGTWRVVLVAVTGGVVVLAAATFVPVLAGFRAEAASDAAVAADDYPEARKQRHHASRSAWVALGYCLPLAMAAGFTLFLLANDHAVQQTFFSAEFMSNSAADVTAAFRRNVFIAVAAEVLVLVWGLVVAIARLAPGPAGRPLRWLATAYVDVFRAIPAIIVIYLIGFGLPLAEVPFLSGLSPVWAAVLALTLTYGAYVAEVYRAGIESIHWSQVSAARSLGLSYGKTLRFVVVPQAVRRVTPPLLNDFIGLQKDTALVTVIGTVDAFTQSKTYASNYFNLSSVTVVAALFIIITIPQTRFVDRMLERDARRRKVA